LSSDSLALGAVQVEVFLQQVAPVAGDEALQAAVDHRGAEGRVGGRGEDEAIEQLPQMNASDGRDAVGGVADELKNQDQGLGVESTGSTVAEGEDFQKVSAQHLGNIDSGSKLQVSGGRGRLAESGRGGGDGRLRGGVRQVGNDALGGKLSRDIELHVDLGSSVRDRIDAVVIVVVVLVDAAGAVDLSAVGGVFVLVLVDQMPNIATLALETGSAVLAHRRAAVLDAATKPAEPFCGQRGGGDAVINNAFVVFSPTSGGELGGR